MSTQVIEFVETEESLSRRPFTDAYMLREDRGWLWLQRLAIWILRKIGCYAFIDQATYTRHVVHPRNLLDSIMKQHSGLIELYHRRGERVLMGSQEFYDLAAQELKQPHSFVLNYNWMENGRREVCGMPITVVPWMKGVLVVPKDL